MWSEARLRRVDIALRFDQSDGCDDLSAVHPLHRVVAVLPALVDQPALVVGSVADEAWCGAISRAVGVDPRECCIDVGT
jgi:hypothetical protein